MSIREKVKNYVRNQINSALSESSSLLETKILLGTLLTELQGGRTEITEIRDAEFKIFSQFGEDGIIQHLVRKTGIAGEAKSFVEFGVESYNEANTIFLMMKDNWRGLIMDGSQKNMDTAKRRSNFWRHDLTAVTAFIDRDNINSLISDAGFAGEIGLLSLDIDGNDYWVWEKLTVANPIIVVAEYNSVFGASHAISVPYEAKFQRNKAHYSNLYWGCSIRALEYLADKKGYALVGSNSAGNNVFFVRRDRLGDLKPVISSAAWVDARFRESLDEAGNLTYSSGEARGRLISDLKVVDVVDGQVRRFGDLEKS